MIGRLFDIATAPLVALLSPGPVLDRIASRLTAAPRRLPEEAAMAVAIDALGGELVSLRARDGIRLTGRWLPAEPDTGDGPPGWTPDPREAVLLLHGWSGSIAPDLLELAPFLRRTANVLGLDFRGHGGSDDAPTTFGVAEVEDIAGALAWLGERGIARVALVGSSMGAITAIAATVILGDGRLAAADVEPDAPAAVAPPRPRIVAIVADSPPPELAVVIGSRLRMPFARRVGERALARLAGRLGGDPRDTQPIAMVGLLEDVPLLLVHGAADRTVPLRDARRLAAATPPGTRHVVVDDADHGRAHATDPARYEAEVTDILRAAFAATRS